MTLRADLVHSPDDGGWYATIWDDADKSIDELLPEAGVYETANELLGALRMAYGPEIEQFTRILR